MPSFRALASVFALALLSHASPASAQSFGQPAKDASFVWRVGVLGGGSTRVVERGVPYRFSGGAVGAEVGVTVHGSVYVGVRVLEVIGESLPLATGTRRVSSQHFLVDAGYDVRLRVRGLVLRPGLSIGVERLFVVTSNGDGEHAGSALVLAGLGLVYDVARHLYVGVDARGGYAFRSAAVSPRLQNPIFEGVARLGVRF